MSNCSWEEAAQEMFPIPSCVCLEVVDEDTHTVDPQGLGRQGICDRDWKAMLSLLEPGTDAGVTASSLGREAHLLVDFDSDLFHDVSCVLHQPTKAMLIVLYKCQLIVCQSGTPFPPGDWLQGAGEGSGGKVRCWTLDRRTHVISVLSLPKSGVSQGRCRRGCGDAGHTTQA